MGRLLPWQQEERLAPVARHDPPITHPTMRVGYLVQMLSGMYRRQIEDALRSVRLTETQLAVLIQLAIGPDAGVRCVDLQRRAGATTQSMAGDLPELERRGLLVCDVQHETTSWVRLADAGRDLVVVAERLAAPVEDRALALLSRGEKEVLRALMLRTMTALGKEQQPA